MTDRADVAAVARAAVLAGGTELRRRYRENDDAGDYDAHDVKAAADEAAERRMLPVVRRAFPDHAVRSEEAGEFGGSEPYRWIVDPLDGTNNFAAGLSTFASSVAVRRESEPVVAAVYQPMTDKLTLARAGHGVSSDGQRVTADSDLDAPASTVAMIVGRDVPRDPDRSRRAADIREGLGTQVKRVVDSWAPTVHSTLFARGRIQGLVQFHPDEDEQAVTELLAAEAGGSTRRDGPLFVAATDEGLLETLWEAIEETA